MTIRSDDNLENAGAPQLELWVTPMISLMGADATEVSKRNIRAETSLTNDFGSS